SDYINYMSDDLAEQTSKPAFFEMDVDATRDKKSVSVEVDIEPYVSGNYTLFVAVVEKHTTGNATSNKETDFYQVMMKMLSDANGKSINFTDGQSEKVTFNNIDLSNTNVEEYNDLQVVAWVQDMNSQKVMQSENTGDSDALFVNTEES